MGEPEGTFVDYQTTMVKTAKAIAVTVQEMVRTGPSLCSPMPSCLRQKADSVLWSHPGKATATAACLSYYRAHLSSALLSLAGHQIHH